MKNASLYRQFITLAFLLTIIFSGNKLFAQNNTTAGVTLSNFAEASYKNAEGIEFNAVSQTITLTIQAISSLLVTPDESESSEVITANESVTRKFQICNTSNVSDTYKLKQANISPPAEIAALYFDADNNGLISNSDTLISLNSTESPVLMPGACINVLAAINTNDFQLGERLTINITARSSNTETANGPVEDSGTIINSAGKTVTFTDPVDPTLIPSKLVENQASYIANKNQPLNYSISFRNNGDVVAKNVVVSDELPSQLNYVANSLRLDERNLSDTEDADQGSVVGRLLSVHLAQVAPGQIVRVTFQAVVVANQKPGTGIVNIAKIGAENALAVDTSQAIAVVDPFGTVYAARGGSASPISGARVSISTAQASENLLLIPENQGFEPNLSNTNPYLTTSQGRYSFALRPDQLGTLTQPVSYFVTATATNFRPRLIQITLSPNGNGLFRMTVHALDGMPLAIADGFELTETDTDISSIADVAFNIPMFENSTLELIKTADRVQSEIGDIINYRIEAHNATVAPIFETLITDTLPDSFSYAQGTAQLTRGGTTKSFEPQIAGNVLSFDLGQMASGERISISYRVRVGVNASTGENFNSAIGSGNFTSGEKVKTLPAKAGVRINAGMFSMRQFIIGRVFIDENGDQLFDAKEKPVVGARIYLASGESVITDSEGMYNLPAVSEGSQVLSIDPITVPEGYLLADNNAKSGKDWTRLLRTPLGGGSMLRQNFALIASTKNPPLSSEMSIDDDNAKKIEPKTDLSPSEKQVGTQTKTVQVKTLNNGFAKTSSPLAVKTEFRPIAAGEVRIHSISDNQVMMNSAFNLEITVARQWKAAVELNGQKISSKNIGTTRDDRKNQITTYTFIGLGLKPGPNRLNVTAVSPEGELGKTTETTLYGRGVAKRLEITSDKKELKASGRDSTRIIVKGFDAWGHPAQDDQVGVQTSDGSFIKLEEYTANRKAAQANKIVISQGIISTAGVGSEQLNEIARQQSVNLVNGVGMLKLLSDSRSGTAEIKAILGNAIAETQIQFIPELRPGVLVSLGEVTIGKNAPEMQNRRIDANVRSRVQLFYKGQVLRSRNMLTLAYDSQQPLNRIAGRDRMFQLNPIDRVYPIFGDSSTRFQETESNSKLYARLDRGRSYVMFGDFEADMSDTRLMNYGRKLTGVKLHLENNNGDFITATGARPDTSFARQIIPGGTLGIIQLEYPDLMPGSELLTIETRDRRNPEIIVSRDLLTRGLDYNLDTDSGTVFFLRQIPTFDRELNLVQIVATYEYRSSGFESSVYTARANKKFKRLGLQLGFSFLDQRQTNETPFRLGGFDATLKLPNRGKLAAEWAMSNGSLNTGFNFFGNNGGGKHNGNAFFIHLEQPVNLWQSNLKFEGTKASEGFFNPFGATVTPGNTRGTFSWESKLFNKSNVKFNLIGESNETENVDNTRLTAGVLLSQTVNEKIRFNFGYDFRRFSDSRNNKTVSSNLLTIGTEIKATEKLDFSIKREQNLGESDPSYPNQTTFSANYRVSNWSKIFFTQRLGASSIIPIADLSKTGFSFSKARNETALGVETQFGKYTSMSGRYQLENGINGTDSFAVMGLQNRLPVNKRLSIDVGFERAFHLKGEGQSYNNVVLGANYLPSDSFRSSFRYELRDRDGLGQIFSLGAAGILKPGWTVLGNYRYGNINFKERQNRILDGQAAMAIRPHDTDKYGLLLSYQHRDSYLSETKNLPTSIKSDVLSADGFHQTTKRLELYGRFALRFTGDGNSNLPYAGTLTYLAQARAQYLLSRSFDVAIEDRFLRQPLSGSQRNWFGAEIGYWAIPDLRFGVGYNFSKTQESIGFNSNNIFNRKGVYFVISSKVSRLFNLFGTSKNGLVSNEDQNPLQSNNQKGQ